MTHEEFREYCLKLLGATAPSSLSIDLQELSDFVESTSIGLGGLQLILRFDNGYGASLICNEISYGNEDDFWELAVIHFKSTDPGDYELVYDTPITDDVLGYLDDKWAVEILRDIKALPPR